MGGSQDTGWDKFRQGFAKVGRPGSALGLLGAILGAAQSPSDVAKKQYGAQELQQEMQGKQLLNQERGQRVAAGNLAAKYAPIQAQMGASKEARGMGMFPEQLQEAGVDPVGVHQENQPLITPGASGNLLKTLYPSMAGNQVQMPEWNQPQTTFSDQLKQQESKAKIADLYAQVGERQAKTAALGQPKEQRKYPKRSEEIIADMQAIVDDPAQPQAKRDSTQKAMDFILKRSKAKTETEDESTADMSVYTEEELKGIQVNKKYSPKDRQAAAARLSEMKAEKKAKEWHLPSWLGGAKQQPAAQPAPQRAPAAAPTTSFNTEQEAAAANLPPGTKITIGGVAGTWQ